MNTASLVLAVLATMMPGMLHAETVVENDARDPDVVIKKSIEKPRGSNPVHVDRPNSPPDQTRPPPEEETTPFFCRTEAPFPQDECIPPPEPGEPTDPVEPEAPQVTPGHVVEAVKRVGLPRLTVAVQPAGSTLVNLETIFHTTATPFQRTVPILDSTVDLRATPATYTWHHGDGTTQTTTNPGRPYPALDITHRYRQPGPASARVDVTYHVTYRINGNTWQNLATTITAPGPTTALRIREARPVLTR